MLMQGVHPKVVSERVGHASIGITLDTYSHVLPTMQEQAALAFDELFPSAGSPAASAIRPVPLAPGCVRDLTQLELPVAACDD
jgi:hypothetical protein